MPTSRILISPQNTYPLITLATAVLLVCCIKPISIFPSNQDLYEFFEYTGGAVEKTKTNQVLNFSKGTWYLLERDNTLEFHSDHPGFLDLNRSLEPFYKTIYLNAPLRVLVFPLTENPKKGFQAPFVASSRVPFQRSDKVHVIYQSNNEVSLEDCFKNTRQLNEALSKFDEQKVQELLAALNRVPLVDPQIPGDGKFNSLENHWGYFQNFGKQMLGVMVTDNSENNQAEAKLLETIADVIMARNLGRMLASMYWKNFNLLFYDGSSDERWAMSLALEPEVITLTKQIKQSEDRKQRFLQLRDQLKDLLFPLAEGLVQFYLSKQMDRYLGVYFDTQPETHSNLTELNTIRRNRHLVFPDIRTEPRFNEEVWSFLSNRFNHAQFKDDEESAGLNALKAQIEDVKSKYSILFSQIFLEFYPEIAARLGDSDEQTAAKVHVDYLKKKKKYLQEAFKTYVPDKVRDLFGNANRYDPQKDDELKVGFGKVMQEKGLFLLMGPLLNEVMNLVWSLYEYRAWEAWLPTHQMWAALELDPFEQRDYKDGFTAENWLRMMLVVVGEIPYREDRDRAFYKYRETPIFSYEKRLII